MNIKVLLLSILAIFFLILAFVWNWVFVAGAIIIVLINQKELMKKNKGK